MDFFSHRTELGQNFLVNRAVIDVSLAHAELDENSVVLEVGAGQGVLTRALLDSAASFVHAFEIDRRLSPWLDELTCRRLALHWGDVMAASLAELSPQPTEVVANIPYHITTPLIWKILEELAPMGLRRLILLVQKESADRLTALPHTKDRYPLGITLEAMGNVKSLMKVAPGSFVPAPKVWSSLIQIDMDERFDLACDAMWRRMLRDGFAQRRKKAVKSMAAAGWDKERVLAAFAAAGVSSSARAEELPTDRWLAVLDYFKNN